MSCRGPGPHNCYGCLCLVRGRVVHAFLAALEAYCQATGGCGDGWRRGARAYLRMRLAGLGHREAAHALPERLRHVAELAYENPYTVIEAFRAGLHPPGYGFLAGRGLPIPLAYAAYALAPCYSAYAAPCSDTACYPVPVDPDRAFPLLAASGAGEAAVLLRCVVAVRVSDPAGLARLLEEHAYPSARRRRLVEAAARVLRTLAGPTQAYGTV